MVKKKVGIIIAVVVVVILIAASVSVIELYHPSHIDHPSVFTDTGQVAAPDSLDPATGFDTQDQGFFRAVYQQLVEVNVTNSAVVPVLAYKVYEQNEQNYTFLIRPYAKFSNGQPLNATDVWFSFYRGILMAQGPYVSDYPGMMFNNTNYELTGIALPWGVRAALEYGGYTLTGNLSDQYHQAGSILANILSNFNYNSSDMKVMSYPDQAVVVNSLYNVSLKSMISDSFFEYDTALWWGSILYPAYIDQNGGVQPNTANSYVNLHGAIGSGPYVVKSVAPGFAEIVIQANTNYWAVNHTVPEVATPPSIPEVAIEYGLSHVDRLEDFDTNASAISYVGASSFKSIIDGFYNKADRNGNLVFSAAPNGILYMSMNCHDNYTDNVHFRRALYDATNYTALMDIYNNNYNNSPVASLGLGPEFPAFGSHFYNPTGLPLPAEDMNGAIQNLTIAASELDFYVRLPNGTIIGNTSGTDLSTHTFTITGIAPPTSEDTDTVTILIDSFANIGLKFVSSFVVSSEYGSWTTPANTPQFVDLGWGPDFPDPIEQQLEQLYDPEFGGGFGGNYAWVDNATLQSYFSYIDSANQTVQYNAMKVIYPITYNISAYIWLPQPNDYFFVQPYVHNFYYNPLIGYTYNVMYISYGSGSSTSAHLSPQALEQVLISSNSLQTAAIKS